MLGESGSKPNKIWVSRGGTFYNKTIQIMAYLTHMKGNMLLPNYLLER